MKRHTIICALLAAGFLTACRNDAAAPEAVTLIAESGIGTPDDVRRMREAGADALLVGSAIMDHGAETDVTENTRRLTNAATDTADTTTTDT